MKEDKEKSLDFAQLVVNTVRMIPVVGKPTNIVNAGGSLDRKDRIRSVAISMLGAIPIVGDVSNRVSKGKRMRDPTKTLSEEFEAFLEDLPKGIYKKTITGASRKVISPERLAEMIQEKIKMLEFESTRGCLSNTCFPGGTPILTQAGPIPIEQIKVGMLVNTQNPETGESGDQAVLSVSQTHVRKLFHIHVGKTEIKSTAMHRLYVQEKGFIPAQDLKVGDRLLGLKEGAPETFPIDQIAVQFYETPVIVYNFEVAAWHTYRVGEIGILVHNGKKTCSGKIPEPKKDENLILDLLGYYDIKEVITDIARGEADLDTLKAGASLIPVAKITKVPKVVKAIGNVGKTGFKKGREGDKISKSSQAKQTKARDKGDGGSSSNLGNYKFKEGIDEDLRGRKGIFDKALEKAFDKTRTPKKDFTVTKWGKDKYGKSHPVEWRASNGAEVSVDIGHSVQSGAPTADHVGWQTGGKRSSGGGVRGHIFVDEVPYNR